MGNLNNRGKVIERALQGVRISIVIIISIAVYRYSFFIKGQAILSLLDTILTVSGLLFAVFGAWLALLAGAAVTLIESNSKTRAERDRQVDYVETLVSPMTASAIMVVLGLFMKVTSIYVPAIIKDPYWIYLLKQEVLFILTICFFYQCWYLIRACGVGLVFLINLERKSGARSFEEL